MKIFQSRLIEQYDYDQFRNMMFILPIIKKSKIIVETGLGFGHSTAIFLHACKFLGYCKLFTYEIELHKVDSEAAIKTIKSLELESFWTLREMDSVDGGKEWKDGDIDILYLDSNHSEEYVYNELQAWTPHVRNEGIIFTHDSFSPAGSGVLPPFLAFSKFAEEKGYNLVSFEFPEGQCFLVK